MNILFVWNLPRNPPRTPAEEDAYYAQFELWPGRAAMPAMRRWLQRIFRDSRAVPKDDRGMTAICGTRCQPKAFSARTK